MSKKVFIRLNQCLTHHRGGCTSAPEGFDGAYDPGACNVAGSMATHPIRYRPYTDVRPFDQGILIVRPHAPGMRSPHGTEFQFAVVHRTAWAPRVAEKPCPAHSIRNSRGETAYSGLSFATIPARL